MFMLNKISESESESEYSLNIFYHLDQFWQYNSFGISDQQYNNNGSKHKCKHLPST